MVFAGFAVTTGYNLVMLRAKKGLTAESAESAEKKLKLKNSAISVDSAVKENERSTQCDKKLTAWSAALTASLRLRPGIHIV